MNAMVSIALVTLLSFNVGNCVPRREYSVLSSDKDVPSVSMPDTCKNKSYCTVKGENFPDDYVVLDLLKMNNLFTNIEEMPSYSAWEGADAGSECSGVHRRGPIYYIVDELNRTREVVQSEQYYIQEYDLRWCEAEGQKTSTLHINQHTVDMNQIKLSCENNYLPFDFQVFSLGDTLQMELVTAKIPVCCKCRYDKLQN